MTAPPRTRPPRRSPLKDICMEILDCGAIFGARDELGESLRQVANHCGISHQTLSKIERGVQKTVRPKLAGKLTRYLGLPEEGVFGPPISKPRTRAVHRPISMSRTSS